MLISSIFKRLTPCLIAAALSMFFLDQRLAHFFNLDENQSLKSFGKIITDIGLAENYFIISLAVWICCWWILKKGPVTQDSLTTAKLKADFFRRWSLNFLVGLIVSGIIVHIFKNIIGRARPHQTPDFYPFMFDSFNFNWKFQSMPSGHSQVMFTAATFFAVAFPRWKWLWYSFALLICFSRVMVHDHFLSDTIMGAFTGWLGATLTLYWLRKKKIGLKELDFPS